MVKSVPPLTFLKHLSIFTLFAALAFWSFFQWSKSARLSPVNPFAGDPVDAIGSISIQMGWLVGVLSLARWMGIRSDPEKLQPRGH